MLANLSELLPKLYVLSADGSICEPTLALKVTESEDASEDTSEDTSEDKSTGQSKGKTKELLGADFASFAAADAKQRDGFRSLFGGEGCSGFGKNNLYSICF